MIEGLESERIYDQNVAVWLQLPLSLLAIGLFFVVTSADASARGGWRTAAIAGWALSR